ncbi:SulP family inorganic anion transporter [Desulfoluna spongiiphila]|uniref:Sulfate permease, SulP family n=1 Tax=Desulfoluna spongiiphila TaxID=419481 RepID=A0A1G5GUL5_9BACT|nr:sulfate permease [Desulfoluna spongiiphila]SCY54860.1 sulfate permease, SulP family [Desulfoluna spongiiphila]VVS92902.1 slc26a/sulp transporter [Desulfoluna spongiiphila]
MFSLFVPESVRAIKEGISKKILMSDIMAGVIVGIVALPLAIAFAIASGVKPEQGIFTAVVAGFIISCFGGSRVQIGGPTGAFIIVVFDIVAQYGYEGLAVATMMAGFMLLVMGISKLGATIRFIPYPMTVGFTSGIALIIFTTQIPDFFGLTLANTPGDFIGKLSAYAQGMDSLNIQALAVGAVTLAILLFWPKVTRKVPGSVVAIIATTVLTALFGLDVATIGSRFGSVPSCLPSPSIPTVNWEMIKQLSSPAFTIAMLAAIESLLSAVVADGMIGKRHNANMELVAQGLANMVVPLFGGIPATGAIARTATNIKSGGTTPVAGMVHAVTLLLILLFFGKWAVLIPMATLSAILMMVAYHMSEWRFFVKLLKSQPADVAVMLVTFGLTVFVDLTVAIEVGVVMASLLFMNRMANLTKIKRRTDDFENDPHALACRKVPRRVEIFEINGPFFFGAANRFKDALRVVREKPKVLILRCRHILMIDATALRALEEMVEEAQREKTLLILSGVHAQPLICLEQSGLYYKIGEDNIYANIDDALNGARRFLGLEEVPRPVPFVPTVSREIEAMEGQ